MEQKQLRKEYKLIFEALKDARYNNQEELIIKLADDLTRIADQIYI